MKRYLAKLKKRWIFCRGKAEGDPESEINFRADLKEVKKIFAKEIPNIMDEVIGLY